MHADQDVRSKRLRDNKKFRSDRSFLDADRRDEQENAPYGQQIKLCNHFADIVLLNNEQVAPDAKEQLKEIVRNKLTTYYIPLFNKIVKGEPSYEHQPHVNETMMTTAYCLSKRSSCLKRHVGAVIARGDGDIIAVGFNDVPKGSQSCLLDDRYGWCARDLVLEKIGRRIKYCPNCGVAVKVNSRCVRCGKKLTQFARRCSSCGEDPVIDYKCRKCEHAVFDEFLPGRKPDTGKLLDICRAVHAEENAILNLARIGIPTPEDAVLYTTTFPCNLCANKIIQAGIKKVVYTEPYITKEARELLKSKHVIVEGFEGVKSTAYFRLFS